MNIGSLTVEPGVTITGSNFSGITSSFPAQLTNKGTLVAAPDGWFSLKIASWKNQGTLRVLPNATLEPGGSFSTSDVGTIDRQGGTVVISGLVNNAGQVFETNAQTGSYVLGNGGSLSGGTLRAVDGTSYLVEFGAGGPSFTLSGVTLDATVTTGGQGLYIRNGLTTLAGSAINLGCLFVGTQSVTGTGSLQGPHVSNGTVTFGSGITGHGGIIGNSDPNQSGNLINHGLLLADGFTQIGFARAGSQFISDGTISVPAGQSLTLYGQWTNAAGTLSVHNGTVQLSGSFKWSDLGVTDFVQPKIQISGALDNSNRTLLIDNTTGYITLGQTGQINGGTISTRDGQYLFINNVSVIGSGIDTLSNVTIDGLVQKSPGGSIGSVGFGGDITLMPGSQLLLPDAFMLWSFGGRLRGNGSITLGNTIPILVNSGSLTIDPGIAITISSTGRDQLFGTLINHGLIQSSNGSSTVALTGNWSNDGTLRIGGGTLELGGTFSTGSIGTIERFGNAIVNLTGNVDNTGATLDMASGGAPWWMGSGTITGGTVIDSAPFPVNITGTSGAPSTFKNLTLRANLLISGFAQFGSVTLDGTTLQMNNSSPGIKLLGTNTLDGAATLNISGTDPTIVGASTSQPLIFGPSLKVFAGQTPYVFGSHTTGNVINQATITISGGKEVGFSGTNQAFIHVLNDGVLRVGGASFSNTGSIVSDGGILNLTGGLTPWNAIGITRNGGIVNIAGPYDNSGNTTDLDTTPLGQVDIGAGGAVTGGTLATSARSAVTINAATATLNGVTVNSNLAIENTTTLTVSNGLRLVGGPRSITSFSRDGSAPHAQVLLQPVDGNFLNVDSGSLLIGPGVTVRNSDYAGGTNYAMSVGTPTAALINNGSVIARNVGTTINILGSSVTNNGTFEASRGTLNIDPSTLTNLSGQTLVGGTWSILGAGSRLSLGNAHVTTNDASVILSVTGAVFDPIATLNDNRGRFTVTSGATFTAAGNLLNEGTIVAGTSNIATGSLTIPTGAKLTNHGLLRGYGGVTGIVESDGVITPGPDLNTGGLLTLNGDLTLDPTSVLTMDLLGTQRGSTYDWLRVFGAMTLDGTLRVTLQNGFVPALGASFDVFDATSTSGSFRTFDLPALPAGRSWDTSNISQGVLIVVPEPGSLLIATLTIVPAMRRRRRALTARPPRSGSHRP
jgi:hypothetical protein